MNESRERVSIDEFQFTSTAAVHSHQNTKANHRDELKKKGPRDFFFAFWRFHIKKKNHINICTLLLTKHPYTKVFQDKTLSRLFSFEEILKHTSAGRQQEGGPLGKGKSIRLPVLQADGRQGDAILVKCGPSVCLLQTLMFSWQLSHHRQYYKCKNEKCSI